MRNDDTEKTAPWANWTTTSRTPGILYVVAGLIVLSSGVAGAAAPPATIADTTGGTEAGLLENTPAEDTVADKAPADALAKATEAATEADRSDADTTEDDGPTRFATPYTTGDRLSPEEIAAYKAYLASIKGKGLHKGPGVVTSWG